MVLRKANESVITEPQLQKLIHSQTVRARNKATSDCWSIPALLNTDRWSAEVEELTGPVTDQRSLQDLWPLPHHGNKITAR